jgi:hypothetical protein
MELGAPSHQTAGGSRSRARRLGGAGVNGAENSGRLSECAII